MVYIEIYIYIYIYIYISAGTFRGHQAVRESFVRNISYNHSKLSKLPICHLTIPSKLVSSQLADIRFCSLQQSVVAML